MAAVTVASSTDFRLEGSHWITWTPLTSTNTTGSWYPIGKFTDVTIHAYGTWDGATLIMQGSNELDTPTSAITLTDPGMTAISMTADAMESLMQNPVQFRPSISTAGASTSLTISVRMSTGARR